MPKAFFSTEIENNSYVYMESQKILRAKTILRKNNKARGILLLDFKLYYKVKVIKHIVLEKDQFFSSFLSIGQWSTVESPEMNPCIYGKLISYKVARNAQCGKDNLFKKLCWENLIST